MSARVSRASREPSASGSRLLHQRTDSLVNSGVPPQDREGCPPHRSMVQGGTVAEADHAVAGLRYRRALKEADDLPALARRRTGRHAVPGAGHEIGCNVVDERVQLIASVVSSSRMASMAARASASPSVSPAWALSSLVRPFIPADSSAEKRPDLVAFAVCLSLPSLMDWVGQCWGSRAKTAFELAVPAQRVLRPPPATLHRIACLLVARVTGRLRFLEVAVLGMMTSSALSPWCSRSHGPPKWRQVIVFISPLLRCTGTGWCSPPSDDRRTPGVTSRGDQP